MLPAVGDDYFFTPSPTQLPHAPPPATAPARSAGPRPDVPVAAAAAGFGSLLMLVGAWAPWVTVTVFSTSEHVGGLREGLNGRWVLALGFAAILTAGTVAGAQANLQVRMVCGGVLLGVGVVGLGIVVHDWTTVADRFREVNTFFDQFRDRLATSADGTNPLTTLGFDGFEVSKAWGLTLSGVASAITGLAGGYLLATK
jgi:hypothetical protein